MKIVTTFWAKPIPDRQFDWTGYDDERGPEYVQGFGSTEQEAVADFLEEIDQKEAFPLGTACVIVAR
jgi:hypothetical protein